jgi:hypothetical protein
MTTHPMELPVIGAMPRTVAVAKLREVGEEEAAEALERSGPHSATFGATDWWPFRDKAWQHTPTPSASCLRVGAERKT